MIITINTDKKKIVVELSTTEELLPILKEYAGYRIVSKFTLPNNKLMPVTQFPAVSFNARNTVFQGTNIS